MDLIKSIRDNYLLCSAIIFVLLLILYALFYKRSSPKEKEEPKESKEKDLFIQYTFYLIFALLISYALYLVYIQYVKKPMMMSGGGGVSGGNSMSQDIRMVGEDVDIGFLE